MTDPIETPETIETDETPETPETDETIDTPKTPTTHPEFVALVRDKLDTAGFTDIEFRANDDGEYAALGSVSTKGEEEQVRDVLNGISDEVKRDFCGMRGIWFFVQVDPTESVHQEV